jgi:hypothetical protein
MPKNAARAILVAAALAGTSPALAADYSVSGLVGYQDGLGFMLSGAAGHLLPKVPIGISVGVGYVIVDPGDPVAVRSIFINDGTDGTPQTSGHVWDLRLDVLYDFRLSGLEQFGVFLGPRFASFAGRFVYVGGNEDFTISSSEWGVGAGVRGTVPFSSHWGLGMSLGFDWYPSSTLYGHDTTYASSGTIINGRNAYTWANADAAVGQPRFVPTVLIGVNWKP